MHNGSGRASRRKITRAIVNAVIPSEVEESRGET
jgi:hypothetical protein